jgi:hypothetical protein
MASEFPEAFYCPITQDLMVGARRGPQVPRALGCGAVRHVAACGVGWFSCFCSPPEHQGWRIFRDGVVVVRLGCPGSGSPVVGCVAFIVCACAAVRWPPGGGVGRGASGCACPSHSWEGGVVFLFVFPPSAFHPHTPSVPPSARSRHPSLFPTRTCGCNLCHASPTPLFPLAFRPVLGAGGARGGP